MGNGVSFAVPKAMKSRFLSKLIKEPSGCWLWSLSKDKDGYGRFALPGKKNIQAHRMAWLIAHGEIPAGLEVMHTCDVPACCRPSHLKLGTHAENMADRDRKGRAAKGERNGNYKGRGKRKQPPAAVAERRYFGGW